MHTQYGLGHCVKVYDSEVCRFAGCDYHWVCEETGHIGKQNGSEHDCNRVCGPTGACCLGVDPETSGLGFGFGSGAEAEGPFPRTCVDWTAEACAGWYGGGMDWGQPQYFGDGTRCGDVAGAGEILEFLGNEYGVCGVITPVRYACNLGGLGDILGLAEGCSTTTIPEYLIASYASLEECEANCVEEEEEEEEEIVYPWHDWKNCCCKESPCMKKEVTQSDPWGLPGMGTETTEMVSVGAFGDLSCGCGKRLIGEMNSETDPFGTSEVPCDPEFGGDCG